MRVQVIKEYFQKFTVAAVPLNSFYAYGESNGDSSLRQTDPSVGSAGVYLSKDFVFYDSSYSLIYVSDNIFMSPLFISIKKIVIMFQTQNCMNDGIIISITDFSAYVYIITPTLTLCNVYTTEKGYFISAESLVPLCEACKEEFHMEQFCCNNTEIE